MGERHAARPTTEEFVDPITVNEGGVIVEKSTDPYRDDVVKVVFHIRSDRDGRIRLRLVDELPEQIDTESVGFHPDYDPDAWRVGEDRTVVYEAVIEPGDTRETVYGARVPSSADGDLFDGPPTVELTAGSGDGRGASKDTDDGLVYGEKLDDGSPRAAPVEALADGDGSNGSLAAAAGDSRGDEAKATTKSVAEPSVDHPGSDHDRAVTGSAIDRLVEELRAGELTDAQRTAIREALGMEPPTWSEVVRLGHVQATVDDLVAYRDALEGFIDENGPVGTLVADLERTLEVHGTDIDALETAFEALERRYSTLEESQADAEEIADRFDAVDADLADAVGTLDDTIDTVRADIDRMQSWREKLSAAARSTEVGVEPGATTD